MSDKDSGTYFANMLGSMGGLGTLMQTINDPAFHVQIKMFVEAIGDIQTRVLRIEAMLERLTDARGFAATLAQLGTDGVGTSSVTGGVADDGTSGAAPPAGGAGNGSGATGRNRIGGGIA